MVYWTVSTHIHGSMLYTIKKTWFHCKEWINTLKIVCGILASCYLGRWVPFRGKCLKQRKHWFCPNNLSHCVSGTKWKYVIDRPQVSNIWLVQQGINLIQNEVTCLEEFSFSFNCLWRLTFGIYLGVRVLLQSSPLVATYTTFLFYHGNSTRLTNLACALGHNNESVR